MSEPETTEKVTVTTVRVLDPDEWFTFHGRIVTKIECRGATYELGGRETGVQGAIRGSEDLAARFPLGSKWTPGPAGSGPFGRQDWWYPVWEVVGYTDDPRRPLLMHTKGRRDEASPVGSTMQFDTDEPAFPWVPYLGDES